MIRKLGAFRKFGAFRLGRKLVRIWGLKSKSRSVTARLIGWVRRCLARRTGGGDYHRIGERVPDADGAPPKGHLAVYVGGKREGGPLQRYHVPVIYFNHPLFGELLREYSEAEFGFRHPGRITIPCPISYFERVQTRIARASDRLRGFPS